MPDIRAKCCQYRWTLQQDGAPSHIAKNTEKLPQSGECFIHRASDDHSIDEWRRRLTQVVQQQGGHTEHITL